MRKKEFNLNFVGSRKIFFIIAAVLTVIVLAIAPFRAKLDVQFAGGTMITYTYDGAADAVDTKALASEIQSVIGKEVTINITSDMISDASNIVVTVAGNDSLSEEMINKMNDAVIGVYKNSETVKNVAIGTTNNVDPSMGSMFFVKCLVAVFCAFLLIVVYVAVRFRKIGGWSAGIMAIVALLFDIVMVFGAFLALNFTLDSNFIAVVLTILGYSVNDTIVIYDRIRENEGLLGKKLPIGELVNRSINQTFNRTLNTSITTLITMFVISIVAVVFNIDSILRFSLPMMIGLIAGVFSSNCIATGLWVSWLIKKEKNA